jgi:hypothetical protein
MINPLRIAATILLVSAWLYIAVPAQAQHLSETDDAKAAEILRSAHSIFIATESGYFNPATLENELLKRPEFEEWGLVITRNADQADLMIEVDRKLFTTSFVYSVIERRTTRVLDSGRVNSIGGTVEGKICESFIKRMKQIRPLTSTARE